MNKELFSKVNGNLSKDGTWAKFGEVQNDGNACEQAKEDSETQSYSIKDEVDDKIQAHDNTKTKSLYSEAFHFFRNDQGEWSPKTDDMEMSTLTFDDIPMIPIDLNALNNDLSTSLQLLNESFGDNEVLTPEILHGILEACNNDLQVAVEQLLDDGYAYNTIVEAKQSNASTSKTTLPSPPLLPQLSPPPSPPPKADCKKKNSISLPSYRHPKRIPTHSEIDARFNEFDIDFQSTSKPIEPVTIVIPSDLMTKLCNDFGDRTLIG